MISIWIPSLRPVRTGISDGIQIEVKEGLTLGQKVRGNQIYEEKKR